MKPLRLNIVRFDYLNRRFYIGRSYSSLPSNKYSGPNYDKLLQVRKSKLTPVFTSFYKKPLALHRGERQWLYDIDGKKYLDMFGGICTVSVGHCHPKITDAVTKQMKTLGHVSNLYIHSPISEYAERLAEKFPEDLNVAYFVNSGSEANDLAVLMARCFTNNYEIISLKNCYHGMTNQTMGLTSLSFYKYPNQSSSGVQSAMNPDVYRGIWGGKHCRDSPVQTTRKCSCSDSECVAKEKYVEQFQEVFRYNIRPGNLAGFFAESIQGVGGTVQFPKGYLKAVHGMVKENGGVYIADEVQTGFGRTGDTFWGFEMHGVKPDIVTMAKGIGNGFPLGAVITRKEIADALVKSSHFNTYGGNPMACAAGMAVLDVIDEEKLQENCKTVGTHLLLELEKLRSELPVVGDVRGKGLMIGVELTRGDGSIQPLEAARFTDVMEACKDAGLIVGKGGYYGNVIRIKPPMCITKEDADFTVNVLRNALKVV